MPLTLTSTLTLNNGVQIPVLGFGTWKLSGNEAKEAVLHALQAGYRHIDTAAIYGNEQEVGEAIRESGIPRKDIFITTKLWNDDHDHIEEAFQKSLQRLGVDYVDLYLMHWPVEHRRVMSWKVMEKLYSQKKCRAIGVSNFTIRHLQELLAQAKVVPAVNQFELSPYLSQPELVQFCKGKGIAVEAYSPLTRGRKLADPKLVAIAQKYGKTPAQILIRWPLQHGLVVLPKSATPERINENADVFGFEISKEDMKKLDAFNENFRVCWDPTKMA
ncbi:MAG TPA: aldo/keto reductase [Candidatus Nanoarchaeia archaeon]|nr:aldo/keto reductase [Candidatus Nanoarchaeia archaeon]